MGGMPPCKESPLLGHTTTRNATRMAFPGLALRFPSSVILCNSNAVKRDTCCFACPMPQGATRTYYIVRCTRSGSSCYCC